MSARFKDALIHRTIFLPEGLEPPDRQWRIAYCLGHLFLHEGNQLLQAADRPKQEREADLVATYLMKGIPMLMDIDTLWKAAGDYASLRGALPSSNTSS
ncbi:ImmA/IrrE family metallo-endopeptidase [Chloroflexota bacterium]